jgi:SAM-dependent methyltransferase
MTEPSPPPSSQPSPPPAGVRAAAHSFGAVADAFGRARPGYPPEAARWLAGEPALRVVELGAGTGRLTEELARIGHDVLATDPLDEMLDHLHRRLPDVPLARAAAERIPLADRSADVVVSAQAFHWFDLDRALPEIARVLRPGGVLALVWNQRDERIPWVRRLGQVLGGGEQESDPTHTLIGSGLFGFVDTATFRFWQPLDRDRLHDLALSRSYVATLPQREREDVLARADALYDDYGRGADGMLLPYVTTCYRAVVRHPRDAEPAPAPGVAVDPPTDDDTEALLIDFQ